MIPVGDAIENKIAFMTGEIDDPVLSRLIIFDITDTKILDDKRNELYAFERNGLRAKTNEIQKVYTRFDVRNYESFSRGIQQDDGYNNQLGADRRTGSGTTPKVKEILFDDEGNIVSKTIRHKSRSTVTSGQYEQMKANLSHSKVYSKKSAMELVSRIAPGIRNRSFEAKSFYIPLINIKNAERPELSMVSPLSLYILSV